MRKGIHVIRGILSVGELKSLLQDGRKGVGWEIVDFKAWQIDGTGSGDAQVVLLTNNPQVLSYTSGDAYNQIAWATVSGGKWESVVEPNRVIVEDLSINNLSNSEAPVNFILTLKQTKLTAVKRILELVKQRGQGALI